jgi:hypothetical protein
MNKLFRLFKIQRSARVKKSFSKGTLASEKAEIKTEIKAYLTLPMTFDFTAYYEDNELENNAEDIPHENSAADTNTEVFCTNNEKSDEVLCSSNIHQFSCCIN